MDLGDTLFLRADVQSAAPSECSGDQATSTQHKPSFVSTAKRLLHRESDAQRSRTTHQHVGLLPECEFCAGLRHLYDTCKETTDCTFPGTMADRVAAARSVLPAGEMLLEFREADWHLARMRRESERARQFADAEATRRTEFLQTTTATTLPPVDETRSLPAVVAKDQAQARLWVLQAARGDHCRHCVDARTRCPECGADALDADPGKCALCRVLCAERCSALCAQLCFLQPVCAVGNDTVATRRTCLLMGARHAEEVRVYDRCCLQCGHRVAFDGSSSGVINWSNERLFCEELFRDYWNTFFTQKQQTVHAYWTHIRQGYEFAGAAGTSFVSRKLFTDATFAFVDMLDVDHDPAFHCPVCRHLPHRELCVALDGITEGYVASMRQAFVPLVIDDLRTVDEVRCNDLVLVPHDRCRRLLARFWRTGLDADEFEEMRSLVDRHAPCLVPLLDFACRGDGDTRRCPKPLRPFLDSIARISPAVGCELCVCALAGVHWCVYECVCVCVSWVACG